MHGCGLMLIVGRPGCPGSRSVWKAQPLGDPPHNHTVRHLLWFNGRDPRPHPALLGGTWDPTWPWEECPTHLKGWQGRVQTCRLAGPGSPDLPLSRCRHPCTQHTHAHIRGYMDININFTQTAEAPPSLSSCLPPSPRRGG